MIKLNKKDINNIFKNSIKNLKLKESKDNYQTILDYLNKQENPKKKYWSIHYAPKDTKNPDFYNERLFYTQENALKIDAIQEIITNPKLFSKIEKEIIQTSLMYNMTWHINTSGTMKGFHNGWGGKGKKALKRILGKIELKKLPFINGIEGVVYKDYAEKIFINNNIPEIDIIYADPPYNQHQYSANYNHLNTLVRNDYYYPGKVIKGSRAGIRKDHTRSDFCKSQKEGNIKIAEKAFINFINNIKAKYIILSYNNEGIIDIERLIDILSINGKNFITIEYQIYDKFKGGKGTQTSNKVIEYLIVVKQNVKQKKEDLILIKRKLKEKLNKNLFLDSYIYPKENDTLKFKNKDFFKLYKDNDIIIEIDESFKVIKENIEKLNKKELLALKKMKIDLIQLMDLYKKNNEIDLMKKLLKKFKIKKYKQYFDYYTEYLKDK